MSPVLLMERAAAPAQKKLRFRRARPEEAAQLKTLYESAWGNGIGITEEQLLSQMAHFPEGQLLGCLRGSDIPITMINIMATIFDPKVGFRGGYNRVTGDRTFSTHIPPDFIRKRMQKAEKADNGCIGVALCVSVAVLPEAGSQGFAAETLNTAISFAESCGLAAVPYSAPRGFARARKKNPRLDVRDYLSMTITPHSDYEEHALKIMEMNRAGNRICRAFGGVIPMPSRTTFEYYKQLGDDDLNMAPAGTAFGEFLRSDALVFGVMSGRHMLVEDFCAIMGRRLSDPVMRLHVENGARYVRDAECRLSAVFANSRPEDRSSLGYNVLLSYDYNPLLVGLDLR